MSESSRMCEECQGRGFHLQSLKGVTILGSCSHCKGFGRTFYGPQSPECTIDAPTDEDLVRARLADLIKAVAKHRADLWGEGPILNDVDKELYDAVFTPTSGDAHDAG